MSFALSESNSQLYGRCEAGLLVRLRHSGKGQGGRRAPASVLCFSHSMWKIIKRGRRAMCLLRAPGVVVGATLFPPPPSAAVGKARLCPGGRALQGGQGHPCLGRRTGSHEGLGGGGSCSSTSSQAESRRPPAPRSLPGQQQQQPPSFLLRDWRAGGGSCCNFG